MAEKDKQHFGPEVGGGEPPPVYQTPDYKVSYGRLSGPESVPVEQRVRYVIQHKKHRVIYGTAAGIGQAIAACIQAQIELNSATEAAKEYEARNFKPDEQQNTKNAVPTFDIN